MKKIVLLLLPFVLFLSCSTAKQENPQEKAQRLIEEKYSGLYVAKPIFEFRDKLIKFEKEQDGDAEAAADYIMRYTAIMDDRTPEDIGYVLKYITIVEGNTFMFIATFDKQLENVITNNLYENALYSGNIVDVEDMIKCN